VDGVFANQIAAVGKDTVYFSVRFTNTGIAGGTGHGKDCGRCPGNRGNSKWRPSSPVWYNGGGQ